MSETRSAKPDEKAQLLQLMADESEGEVSGHGVWRATVCHTEQ
jgi:hypothetical protein